VAGSCESGNQTSGFIKCGEVVSFPEMPVLHRVRSQSKHKIYFCIGDLQAVGHMLHQLQVPDTIQKSFTYTVSTGKCTRRLGEQVAGNLSDYEKCEIGSARFKTTYRKHKSLSLSLSLSLSADWLPRPTKNTALQSLLF
jgi:hypothetical protein